MSGRNAVDHLSGCVYVSMGEDPASRIDEERGLRPRGEFFALQRCFEETVSMRERAPDAWSGLAAQAMAGLRIGRALARRDDVRLVYLAEELPGLFVLAGLVAGKSRAKRVMLCHNVGSRLRTLPLGVFGAARALDRVLCLAESSRRYLVDVVGVEPARVRVLGSRVDERFFRTAPPQERSGAPLVVSAGAIQRDYETLVEACGPLDVDVKIAADTAWRFSLARGRPVPRIAGPRLEMRSWGTYEALRDLYARADVVAVPLLESDSASGQTVLLEAMSMGKPVVTSDIRAKSDFIEHGVHGLLVPPQDPGALRDAIARLLRDPVYARALGARAAAHVRAHYTVDDYVARILSACRDVLEEQPARVAA